MLATGCIYIVSSLFTIYFVDAETIPNASEPLSSMIKSNAHITWIKLAYALAVYIRLMPDIVVLLLNRAFTLRHFN